MAMGRRGEGIWAKSKSAILSVASHARLGPPLFPHRPIGPIRIRFIVDGAPITPKKCAFGMDAALGHRPE